MKRAYPRPMSAPAFLRRLADPFGFADALAGLTLHPADLPTWSREACLEGAGH